MPGEQSIGTSSVAAFSIDTEDTQNTLYLTFTPLKPGASFAAVNASVSMDALHPAAEFTLI